MTAEEFLKEIIPETNIPENWYEREIAELMEQYAKEQAVEFAEKYGLEISLASNIPFIEDLYDQFKQQ